MVNKARRKKDRREKAHAAFEKEEDLKRQKKALSLKRRGDIFSNVLEPIKQRKLTQKVKDEFKSYENVSRYNPEFTQEYKEKLPVITRDGQIKKVAEKVLVTANEKSDDEESEQDDENPNDESEVNLKQDMKLNPALLEIKYEDMIEEILQKVLSDPQSHVKLLDRLAEIEKTQTLPGIRMAALKAQCDAYRDLIPGYRIHASFDDDNKQVVHSKEVSEILAYERPFIKYYSNYVDRLTDIYKSYRKKNKEANDLEIVAIDCAGRLMVSSPHFNFFEKLAKIVINRLTLRTMDEGFHRSFEYVRELFKEDEVGKTSLQVVEWVAEIVEKRRYAIRGTVIDLFLHLRLLDEYTGELEEAKHKKAKGYKLKIPSKYKGKKNFSRKERQMHAEKLKVESEMRKYNAVVSKDEREKAQSQTLKIVFKTYLNILKRRNEQKDLVGPALEGVSRFAHLINKELFGDFLEVAREILEEDDLSSDNQYFVPRNTLLALSTVFILHSKQVSGSDIDLSWYVNIFYCKLLVLAMHPDLEKKRDDPYYRFNSALLAGSIEKKALSVNMSSELEMIIRTIDFILTYNRNISQMALVALFKRCLTFSLNVVDESSVPVLAILSKLVARYDTRLECLFDTESRTGNGRFNMLAENIRQSNSGSTTAWEVALLRKHYNPATVALTEQVCKPMKAKRS